MQDIPYDPTQCLIGTDFGNVIVPIFTQNIVIFANTRSPTEAELQSCVLITLISSKIWNPHEINFPTPTNVIKDGQFIIKACESSRRIPSTQKMRPRMVSASKIWKIGTLYFLYQLKNL